MKSIRNPETIIETCYHCGETCRQETVRLDDHAFCCDGCKTVYDLLKTNDLCTYYDLSERPGISPDTSRYSGKYDYLDNETVFRQLVRFDDANEVHVLFYIPGVHCSSCIWLLEHLHTLRDGIAQSSVNFLRREVTIVYDKRQIRLSEIAELLAAIGYEPSIHLDNLEKQEKKPDYGKVLRIGIAGFSFGNIMMLSFPEYFSFGNFSGQETLGYFFGYLNLALALPVFFYSASGFFVSAWKSIRHRHLNIDAPIALAILVTFLRSVYEIVSHTGAGYLDSMTGIVFFMLLGRYFQDKTYQTLSFERDYRSYFPVGVSVRTTTGQEEGRPVSELKKGDRIVIRNRELVPADAVLLSPQTHIDYSFITGESAPVKKQAGDLIYAGGRQLGGAIELEVAKPVSQSYLTRLWNREETAQKDAESYIGSINLWFTVCVLLTASAAAAYWLFTDSSKALNALTAVLIVACPCGLLLTATFANGSVLRALGRNKCYLRNAAVIDRLAQTDTIIFDKTGTITQGSNVEFAGAPIDADLRKRIASLAGQSSHPLSRAIHACLTDGSDLPVTDFREFPGKGTSGNAGDRHVVLGSADFVTGTALPGNQASTRVFVSVDNFPLGYFRFSNAYREGLGELIAALEERYTLGVLSGDNDSERAALEQLFGTETRLLFNRLPDEKMAHIRHLQENGHKVTMIGDGLNDAGALQQSDVGIAISDDTNTFSPACDVILDGSALKKLPAFIRLAKAGKRVIVATFALSLVYNLIGVSFAVQGILSPVVAAILMPASSISIVVLTTLSTGIIARRLKL